jgi:hypothetical protein
MRQDTLKHSSLWRLFLANGNGGVWIRYTVGTIIMIVTFFSGIFIGPPIMGAIKDSQTVVEHERRIEALESFKEKGDRWTASDQRRFERDLEARLHQISRNQLLICNALEIECAEIQ